MSLLCDSTEPSWKNSSKNSTHTPTPWSGDKPSSFSGLDLFEGCERRFFYEKVEGHVSPEGAPLLVGSSYHEVLADLWRLPGTTLASLVAQQVEKDGAKLEAVGVDLEGLRNEMVENIARVQKLLFVPGGCVPLDLCVEKRFDDPLLGYRGVIDVLSSVAPLVDGAGRVVGFTEEECVLDYKVVTSDRRRSERDARFSTQLALYCLVAGVTRACFVEIPRNIEKPVQVRTASFSVKELDNAKRYLIEGRAAIKSRGVDMLAFKRAERSYPLCSVQWCPFWSKCYGS